MQQNPKCPMGHEMELIQTASGSWRYGCLQCATSFKAIKRPRYGWLSPMKSTKERAYAAAMARPLRKPATLEEVDALEDDRAVYIEFHPVATDVIMRSWGDEAKCFYQGYYARNEYGKAHRCWLDRKPTEEERKAAEWEK